MNPVTETVHKLFVGWYGNDYDQLTQLQRSGSDRIYFRIYTRDESYIATYNLNVKENKTLIAADAVVVENGHLEIANPQFTLNLQQAIASVKMMEQLDIETLICYHGGVFEKDIKNQLRSLVAKYSDM